MLLLFMFFVGECPEVMQCLTEPEISSAEDKLRMRLSFVIPSFDESAEGENLSIFRARIMSGSIDL